MEFLALKPEEWHDRGDVCKEDTCPLPHCEMTAVMCAKRTHVLYRTVRASPTENNAAWTPHAGALAVSGSGAEGKGPPPSLVLYAFSHPV